MAPEYTLRRAEQRQGARKILPSVTIMKTLGTRPGCVFVSEDAGAAACGPHLHQQFSIDSREDATLATTAPCNPFGLNHSVPPTIYFPLRHGSMGCEVAWLLLGELLAPAPTSRP
jgi:hypothetical protein